MALLDGYGNWTECQSYLGWGISPYANTTGPVQGEFLYWMMNGYTANRARFEAINTYCILTNQDPVDEWGQPILRLWGDFDTRISGVYSGTFADSPKMDWYGPIPN